MADVFGPLDRVVAKYRRDVHQLPTGASSDALASLEGHLQRPLPNGMRVFLARHNGAHLFRGALRIRSAAEWAAASDDAPQVTLFADGQGDVRWAWAPVMARAGTVEAVFGRWNGEALEPLHSSFAGWLAGSIALLDTRVARPEDQEALRFEAAPDDVYQLLRAGERALAAGRPEKAEEVLRRATALDPEHVVAWQRLGEALAATDRQAARMAWLQAFRAVRLPLPWPGAPCLDPEVAGKIAGAFPDAEAHEKELVRFLTEQVRDVASSGEAAVVVAVARELAASKVRRGKRAEARDSLSDLMARCRLFRFNATPWDAVLELAHLEFDLGHHDEAEALLRQSRLAAADPAQATAAASWRGPALVALARIAVTRQEPWAEEILDEAVTAGLDDAEQIEVAVLRVERASRLERRDEARRHLDEATHLARRVAVRSLLALVALAEADVLRLEGDRQGARVALRRGLGLLGERDDAELRGRLLLRLGDLAIADEKRDDALRDWQQAVGCFSSHQLPVREAWTLLRLARVARDPAPLLEAARDRFVAADLAAGVAAHDAVRGDPGASLAWHLDRAAAQARARHDAQRSRPPWERADADRPERRLGAHRLAIAACSEGVVVTLAREMEACVRAIGAGRGRALDPPVMRYIAAVDLLSAHRSYPAAQVLLEHLLRSPVEGPARRALQGAIARSPNAALVDGLLSCIENAASWPADAVAQAAEVLGLRREKESVGPLCTIAAPGSNPISRKAAVSALGRIGDREVVDEILPALDDPGLAEQAALALLMLGDRRGVDFHGRALADGRRDLSGSPGEIVGRYGGPSHLLLLVRSAEGSDERSLGALQGLGLMGDPRVGPTLLKALAQRDRRVVEVAAGALTILTGHDEPFEEGSLRNRWTTWWETYAPRLKEGVRHRDGKVFDAALLLDKMDHDDPWVRRTAYDELVITTGGNLPFDSDGPWRVQRAHLRAWREWWAKNGGRQMAGRWYLDGMPLS